jgi:tetratricopeptide (TPR) repeat protein
MCRQEVWRRHENLESAGVAVVLAVLAGGSGCRAIKERQDMDRANKLFAAKKYDQAIPVYEKILKSSPDDWSANYYLAMSWMAQFHPASTHPMDQEFKTKAVASLNKLMTLTPPSKEDMAKVENYYLSLLTSAGDNDQAIAFLEKKIQKAPSDKDLMAQLAPAPGQGRQLRRGLEVVREDRRAGRQEQDQLVHRGRAVLGALEQGGHEHQPRRAHGDHPARHRFHRQGPGHRSPVHRGDRLQEPALS